LNLHSIAAGAISAVNPMQSAAIQISNGYLTGAQGRRGPSYLPAVTVSAQVQELTAKDLRHLDQLNIQGSKKKIYMNGIVSGTVRVNNQGGDLVTLQDGTVWLTTAVLEQWPDWVAVSVTLQDGS
jgi:hypothetical protein